jgi:serine/threonine protein kinase
VLHHIFGMNVIEYVWKELQEIGFQGNVTSIDELHSWLRRIRLIYVPKLLKQTPNGFMSIQDITYSEFTPAMTGKFGCVYLVYREKGQDGNYVFLKTSVKHPQALLLEGILHSISHSILSWYGFPNAIPKVLDIIQHPDFGIVFSTQRIPGSQIFADYLKDALQWETPCEENDHIVFQVIAQVATYVAILESVIGLNHRDLKGTNVLMVSATEPWVKSVSVKSRTWSLRSNLQTILIDFGFACVGTEGRKTVISAGEYLPTIDFCPKEGRDLFLFFAGLWNVEAFRKSLTEKGGKLFYKWLRDTSETSWADWLIASTYKNLQSMYLLTNADHFESAPSAPLAVLENIAETYPEIIAFEA